jgi:hypothetical protein
LGPCNKTPKARCTEQPRVQAQRERAVTLSLWKIRRRKRPRYFHLSDKATVNPPSQTSFIVPAPTNKCGRAGTERHLTIITTGVFSSSLLGYGKAPKARSVASRYIMCRVPLATCHPFVPNISTKPRFYHLTELR